MSYPYPSLDFPPQRPFDPYAPEHWQRTPFPEATPDVESEEEVTYPLEVFAERPVYARGGSVQEASLSPLANMLQKQGRYGDTLLAHINPLEAQILGKLSGGPHFNPVTGLPEYFFGGLKKFFKKIVGPVGGAILGNMILPGAGALLGGGLGGMFGHPNDRMGPLAGAGIGAMAPLALSGLGGFLSGAGGSSAGGLLTSLAGQTANPLTSLLMPGMVSGGGTVSPFSLSSLLGGGNPAVASAPFSLNPVTQLSQTLAAKGASSPGFLSSLLGGATGQQGTGMSGYLGQLLRPQNAIPLASLGYTMATHVSPEQQYKAQYKAQADAQKYLEDMLHAPDRMRQRAQLERELEREKWEPLTQGADEYETEQVSPEEYERTGRWFKKYKKDKQGQRVEVPYAKGGDVRSQGWFREEGTQYPSGQGYYIEGETGGQDDKIPAWLSDGEYVLDANTVSALGDGNNTAGAKRLDEFREKLLEHKGMKGFPPKTKPLSHYLS